jgi:uncharacterized protein
MSTTPPRRPSRPAPAGARRAPPASPAPAAPAALAATTPGGPLSEAELQQLQALMDGIPDTLEPLDVVMIDGYLCGVLLQPDAVPTERWLALIPDVDGRKPPNRFDLATMRALVLRRHAELDRAIAHRQWFDPWVYQLDDEASPSETVLPWVAGFATAVDAFTGLMDRHEDEILEPLATLYRHLDPDDLEDADELLAEIETLAPPETLAEAVEDLVRSVLLMADVSRPVAGALAKAPPLAVAARGARPPAKRPPAPGRRGPRGPR